MSNIEKHSRCLKCRDFALLISALPKRIAKNTAIADLLPLQLLQNAKFGILGDALFCGVGFSQRSHENSISNAD